MLLLEATYQPGDNALDVAVALNDHWQSIGLRSIAEDKLVPPAGADGALRKIMRLNRRLELK